MIGFTASSPTNSPVKKGDSPFVGSFCIPTPPTESDFTGKFHCFDSSFFESMMVPSELELPSRPCFYDFETVDSDFYSVVPESPCFEKPFVLPDTEYFEAFVHSIDELLGKSESHHKYLQVKYPEKRQGILKLVDIWCPACLPFM